MSIYMLYCSSHSTFVLYLMLFLIDVIYRLVSDSQTVCRGTLVCRHRFSGVPRSFLEFWKRTVYILKIRHADKHTRLESALTASIANK